MRPRQPIPSKAQMRRRLGENLRECRKRRGASQHGLALHAEMALASISLLELGRKLPRIDSFLRLTGALEIAPSELTAGILWTPGVVVAVPGSFLVPEDRELAAEVAALRGTTPPHRRRSGR